MINLMGLKQLNYRKIADMKIIVLSLVSLLFTMGAYGQSDEPTLNAAGFYDSTGVEMSYAEVLASMESKDVVLFGEHHNSAIIHWIQKRLIEDLSKRKSLVLGGEFFERDDQLVINEYLQGLIPDKNFESEAKLWTNYETDYRPILSFAKENELPFIATNVPRRYASLVAKHGLDTLETLSESAKTLMAKLPIVFSMDTPGYEAMEEMMGGHGGANAENFIKAQALKDATMAESILNNTTDESIFIHINGDFHSADYGGIYWYVKKQNPNLNVATIKIQTSRDTLFDESWKATGDIVLVVPDDFTTTH